jgi:hypothetical protein
VAMRSQSFEHDTYLFSWDHDTDLLNGLGKLIWLNGSVVVKVEVFKRFFKYLFL